MIDVRFEHSTTLLPNGKVLVAGGSPTAVSYLSAAELYDPATGAWSATGAMTDARRAHTATLLPNGKVLVTGGHNGSDISSAELYDPASGTWSRTASLSIAKEENTASLLVNGKVLVTGGNAVSAGVGPLSIAELYDPATGTWAVTGAMKNARYYNSATRLANGKVLVVGGYDGSFLSAAELYDSATGTWSLTGTLADARGRYTLTLLPSGQVLVSGGVNSTNSLTSAELYDPTTGMWSPTGAMKDRRESHTATMLNNGTVLIAGGFSTNNVTGILSSAELYFPSLLPTITTQPASQSVVVGQSVTFQVGASGSAPTTYQWLKDGVPITGATNATLTLDNVQAAQAGSYVVVVSSPGGSVTSQAATLTFVGAPIITAQPGSRTVTQGGTFNFTVGIATSATLPLRYQWRYNGIDIPGAINPVFTLANAQPSAAGLYSVLVANSAGTIVSAEAALFVSSPPMVVTHPTNQSVTLGSNVTFTVVASGGTPLTYQWRVNVAPIPGANNQSLTITGAQLSSAGIYDVLVSDGTFSVFSSSAVLAVLPPFAITPQPVGMSTNVGGSATFTVGAVGLGTFNGPFTYQWTFNGTPLAGQTAPSLAFTGLALVNSGNYACVVDSPLGSITSSNALLTVFNPFSVGTTSFQPGGLFQMTASGDDGRAYRLESSTNLVIWTAVVTNTVSGGTATFTDSTAAGNVLRFYRIVLLP
jgi:hypothetical protein